jgi:hypothetical protein
VQTQGHKAAAIAAINSFGSISGWAAPAIQVLSVFHMLRKIVIINLGSMQRIYRKLHFGIVLIGIVFNLGMSSCFDWKKAFEKDTKEQIDCYGRSSNIRNLTNRTG